MGVQEAHSPQIYLRGEFKRGYAPLLITISPSLIKGRGTKGEGHLKKLIKIKAGAGGNRRLFRFLKRLGHLIKIEAGSRENQTLFWFLGS